MNGLIDIYDICISVYLSLRDKIQREGEFLFQIKNAYLVPSSLFTGLKLAQASSNLRPFKTNGKCLVTAHD